MGTLRLKYSKKLIEEEQQKAAGSLEKLEKERETKLSKDVTSSDIGELDQQIAKQEERIKAIGALANQIGKDVDKNSVLYDAARERHMVKLISKISATGKNIIFPVGAAHEKNLQEGLRRQNVRKKPSKALVTPKTTAKPPKKSIDEILKGNNITSITNTLKKAGVSKTTNATSGQVQPVPVKKVTKEGNKRLF